MLKPGARIAVVAPSGAFDADGLSAGIGLLAGWGYQPVRAPNLHARHRFTAGTAAERLADLSWALSDPTIDAAWFARGGYGVVHLLENLSLGAHKPILGFSDATALLLAHRAQGGTAVHAPVLHSLASLPDDASLQRLRSLLATGEGAVLRGRQICGPERTVSGHVLGGNLCVLASIAGTRWALRAEGAILLLEEIAEPPYKIDRLITQLRFAGCLDGVRGVALGDFVRCQAPEEADWTLEDVLVEALEPLGVPVISGLPVGHGPRNHAWVLGGQATLSSTGLALEAAP